MLSKPCWEIMDCVCADTCIAKRNTKKSCWEHSQEIGAVQHNFSVCPDCLVYLVKLQKTPKFMDDVVRSRVVEGHSPGSKIQRCPLSRYIDYRNSRSERREKNRLPCNGYLSAFFRNLDFINLSYHLIDLSQTGIAFTCRRGNMFSERTINLDLHLDDFAVNNLPANIVFDEPAAGHGEHIRYGCRFSDLSPVQESGLNKILHRFASA